VVEKPKKPNPNLNFDTPRRSTRNATKQQAAASPTTVRKARTVSKKRKPVADSESEDISTPLTPFSDHSLVSRRVVSHKKPRIGSPNDDELIGTSQWSEEELPSNDASLNNDTFDSIFSGPIDPLSSSPAPTSDENEEPLTSISLRPLTPPSSPEQLDPATKTAQIIADIKARARAAALAEEDEAGETAFSEFKDELSDSEDEELTNWNASKVSSKPK
jgi:hypothetical protein